jgi:GPI-anchor transamidase subunit GAA1
MVADMKLTILGWSLWSKDIIFLITPDSHSGAQAWVDSYHDTQPSSVQPLPVKSGALQGAIAVDYSLDHRFESLHIIYDGVNGQLPNLDLFNTAVSIASGQMGIRAHLQRMWDHDDSYKKRLETMLRGMLSQGLGHASGPHSSFIPYHIDAITLQVVGEGWQDEMALGRTVESCFRSLNNLLEHFHQSFFFYLLMQTNRFVSIGTYLPSAMLVAGNFTIMAIALWVKSGWPTKVKEGKKISEKAAGPSDLVEDSPPQMLERPIALPLTIVLIAHFLGLIPLYVFNHVDQQVSSPGVSADAVHSNAVQLLSYIAIWFAVFSTLIPYGLNTLLAGNFTPSQQQYHLVKSFSLLLLGLFLSTLATLNFSLAFLVGLLCIPLSFVSRMPSKPALAAILSLMLNLVSPPMVLFAGCRFWDIPVQKVLMEAAFGWHVWGMWTQVVVWCVWWPAWVVGVFLVASSIVDQHQD